MKMVSELSPIEKHRTPEGTRFRTRERESRDFASGPRSNELYLP